MNKKRMYGGVILAAGLSSRMGDFKPLMKVGKTTAAERCVAAFRDAGIEPLLVTGHRSPEIVSLIGDACEILVNPRFEEGMFTSVRAGLRHWLKRNGPVEADLSGKKAGRSAFASGVFLLPVDCPLVSAELLKKLLAAAGETPEKFIVPAYHGKKGHPLFIPGQYVPEIIDSDDVSLKDFTEKYGFVKVETDDEACVLDMDTPEGYRDVLEYLEPEKPVNFSGRLFFVRHGETVQHEGKILLGQADVPLSEQGRYDAANAGQQLANYELKDPEIYTSDLCRATETAEILAQTIAQRRCGSFEHAPAQEQKLPILREAGLREMALADWDGRLIEELQAEFPQEYEARGRDLIGYKRSGGENFYDLQYRSLKALKRILQHNANSRDIILVSHSGTIRALLCAILGYPIRYALQMDIPRGSVTQIDFGGVPS